MESGPGQVKGRDFSFCNSAAAPSLVVGLTSQVGWPWAHSATEVGAQWCSWMARKVCALGRRSIALVHHLSQPGSSLRSCSRLTVATWSGLACPPHRCPGSKKQSQLQARAPVCCLGSQAPSSCDRWCSPWRQRSGSAWWQAGAALVRLRLGGAHGAPH